MESPFRPPYLLVQAYQFVWLVLRNGIYQQFTCVNHTVLALAPRRLELAVSASPYGLAYGFPWVLFPAASHDRITPWPHVPVGTSGQTPGSLLQEQSYITTTYATTRRTHSAKSRLLVIMVVTRS